MKAIWVLISGLFITVIGSLIVVIYQDQVRNTFSPERVFIDVFTGPWYPYGVLDKTFRPPGTNFNLEDHARFGEDGLANLYPDNEDFFARIIIQNNTGQDVTGAKIDFRGIGTADAAIVPTELIEAPIFTAAAKVLDLGKIGPGDKKIVYIWTRTDLSSTYRLDDIKFYSSRGVQTLNRHHYNRDSFNEGIWGTIDSSFNWILGGSACLFGLFSLIVAAAYSQYLSKLLKDDNFYLTEKVRYDADPKKFQPDIS
jgi:hypothetical protein